jgi:hypothetical protein
LFKGLHVSTENSHLQALLLYTEPSSENVLKRIWDPNA